MLHPMTATIASSALDHALSAQIIVAWAGETGEERRLAWWKSDLISEFGGKDLFARLLPNTFDWAVLQGAREAARRHDATLRARDHEPDRLLSLYALGFELDERIDERLQELKRSGLPAPTALPQLVETIGEDWSRQGFERWVAAHGKAEFTAVPSGRRIKGSPPPALERLIDGLVAALSPLADEYPLPHFVRSV